MQELKPQEQREEIRNKTAEILENLSLSASKRIATIDRTLNKEFSFNVAVAGNDKVELNSKQINNSFKGVNKIKVVVNSEYAKQQLKKIGLDFDLIQKEIKASPSLESGLMLSSCTNRFKKVAKDLL